MGAPGRITQRTPQALARNVALASLVAVALAACPTADPSEPPPPLEVAVDGAGRSLPPYEPPHDRPGPATDRILFRAFDVDRAPRELEAGSMDLYLFSLKIAAAQELRDEADFQLHQAPATTLSLILNPAPAPPGQLNPFSIPEIRQAMQHLVDRDFIARDILQGMGTPMLTHLSPHEPDFLTVHAIDRGSGISFDPDLARDRIAAAMAEAGAELVDGVWQYEGQPVRLTLIGRVEDERREIADLVRTELERVGFQVAISYQPFAPAVLRVYSTDPATLEWHLYTEGWGRSAPQRYDFSTINQMAAPWTGNLPGWKEEGFWQYEHDELDDLGQRLFRGEFASAAERDEIYRRMTELALDESVRIWLASVLNHFPADGELTGVTDDLVAGPRGPWTLREAYLPGGEELTVGHLWVWTERTTWNPVGGFGDVYSVDIWRSLHDPPLWNHPFTGIPQPMRAAFEVETAGPDGALAVPEDAVAWDAEADVWRQVPPGTEARSKVTFDYSRYLSSRWHHGEPITMADVLYPLAQSYELAYDTEKVRIETALGVTSRPYLETFRGYRVIDDERLEVYVDFWHFDGSLIAGYASPVSVSMPWEVLHAMDLVVFEQRRGAYSDTAAIRFNVPWLSLVTERDAGSVQRVLRSLASAGTVPSGVFEVAGARLAPATDAVSRYEAAVAWFDEHRHLVISNGPYFLARYDAPAQFAELQAFRDETYPFRPGDWHFGAPPTLSIDQVETPSVTPGEAVELAVGVDGPGTLGLRWLLVDLASSETVASGDAAPTGDARFTVTLDPELTAELEAGFYRLFLVAHSDAVALLAERSTDLEVTP